MGLFDWLKPKQGNVEILDDVAWLTKQAKFAGMRKEVEDDLSTSEGPVAILLVAHFQDCLNELQQVVEAQGLDDRRLFTLIAENLKGTPASMITADEYLVRARRLAMGEELP